MENQWNRLIAVQRKTKDMGTHQMAEMLLKAMNTASGQTIMKREVEAFLVIHEAKQPQS